MKSVISKLNSIIFLVFLSCCAGPNPNPGERTADVLWYQQKYDKAVAIINSKAEQDFPWAQLRLGVAYHLGLGVEKNFDNALKWYKKVAIQYAEGGWANGKLIGSIGKSGYFNQNSDAMVAQYQIASLYLKSDKKHEDIIKAYLWITNLSKISNGNHVFYCCEFAGGRWITQDMIQKTKTEILSKMTEKQKQEANKILPSWSPSVE
ncbi:MAG: sel1 repeat family protein [Chitinophagia bacterium]|nr:sel1 repeat family protein [Chitinophagia bacterium]